MIFFCILGFSLRIEGFRYKQACQWQFLLAIMNLQILSTILSLGNHLGQLFSRDCSLNPPRVKFSFLSVGSAASSIPGLSIR